ncbi:MAG: AI-2E family transporter [Planctomycetota bacterium]
MTEDADERPSQPADPTPASASSIDSAETESKDQVTAKLDAGKEYRPAVTALPSLSRILSVVMLILGILVVGALFIQVMAGFFVPLFLAALLVVLFRPVYEYLAVRLGRKRRWLAAGLTTAIVTLSVLLPVIGVISVAAGQLTAVLTHVDFEDLSGTFDRLRGQLGIQLEHPIQFGRLDELADSLDETRDPITGELTKDEEPVILEKIQQAKALLAYLKSEVDGPPQSEQAAEFATQKLQDYEDVVQENMKSEDEDLITQVDRDETFDRYSVNASAAIRTWMRSKLGGTFRSQLVLMANPSAEDFRQLLRRGREVLQPRFVSLTSATGSFIGRFVVGLVVLVVAVYFFFVDGAAMIKTLMRLSPLDDEYERELLEQFDRTSRAVVLASVISALAQGFLAAIAFWLCGFDSIILLFLITSLMALVPFLGAASVWLPLAISLAAVDQRYLAAVLLAAFGAGVISSVDNLIKPVVLQGRTSLHPLFALLSVLGGLSVFGPIGLIVGPMVVVFLQTLLEILNHELAERPGVRRMRVGG